MQVTQSLDDSLRLNFSSNEPIYLQLAEKLEISIVSGALQSGDKLPPVRELALRAKINPNTVQKSLALLESKKLILTERTNGKYVTKDKERIRRAKLTLAQKYTASFLAKMNRIGLTKKEVKSLLEDENNNLKGASNE